MKNLRAIREPEAGNREPYPDNGTRYLAPIVPPARYAMMAAMTSPAQARSPTNPLSARVRSLCFTAGVVVNVILGFLLSAVVFARYWTGVFAAPQ
jgi:hypothetical protein